MINILGAIVTVIIAIISTTSLVKKELARDINSPKRTKPEKWSIGVHISFWLIFLGSIVAEFV